MPKRLDAVLLAAALCWGALNGCRAETPLSANDRTQTLVRNYPRSADEVWEAAVAAVSYLGFEVLESTHDGWGGRLRSRRADGHPVDVDVATLGSGHSQVTVRVLESDPELAWLLQKEIALRIGAGTGDRREARPESH